MLTHKRGWLRNNPSLVSAHEGRYFVTNHKGGIAETDRIKKYWPLIG